VFLADVSRNVKSKIAKNYRSVQKAFQQQPLSVRLGGQVRKQAPASASMSPRSGSSSAGAVGDRGAVKRKGDSSEFSSTQHITDEADSYKKLRRQTQYRECSRRYIRYFTDEGKLYTMPQNVPRVGGYNFVTP